MFGHTVLLAWCLGVVACGSSEPRSPLILGDQPTRALPGPRDLTSEQSRSLQGVIASAGEPCGAVTLAYLSGIDAVNGSEAGGRCRSGTPPWFGPREPESRTPLGWGDDLLDAAMRSRADVPLPGPSAEGSEPGVEEAAGTDDGEDGKSD